MNGIPRFAQYPDGTWIMYSGQTGNEWVPVEPEVVYQHRPDLNPAQMSQEVRDFIEEAGSGYTVYQPVGPGHTVYQRTQPPQTSNNTLLSYIAGAGAGLTGGWMDELAEQAKRFVTDAELEEIGLSRDQFGQAMRTETQKLYNQADFWPRLAGEITGGALTGGTLFKAIKGLTRLTPLGAAVVAGGTEGGIAGAGYASEGERLGGAGIGAGFGAVAAPVASYALSGLSAAGNALWRRLQTSPRSDALRLLQQAVQADAITPQDAQTMLREIGPESVPADLGSNLTGLAHSAYAPMGPGRQRIESFLTQRQAGQQGRIADIARQELGPKWHDYWKYMDDVTTAREAQSKPYYDRAFQQAIQPTEALGQVLQTDAGQKALAQAQTRMRDKIGLMQDAGTTISADGQIGVRVLHQMKRALNDRIASLTRAGQRERARDIIEIRNVLREELGKQVPEYRVANNIYAGGSDLLDAAEIGRDFLRNTKMYAGDLEQEIKNFTQGEMDALRVGFFRGILDKVETTMGAGDSVRRVTRDERTRSIARRLFPDAQRFDQFIDRLAGEQRQYETMRRTLQGSPTAPRQAFEESLGEQVGIGAEMAQAASASGWTQFLLPVLRMLSDTPNVTPEIADELSKLLFNRNLTPNEWARIAHTTQRNVAPILGVGSVVPAVGVVEGENQGSLLGP